MPANDRQARQLTPAELGAMVRLVRHWRQWSQEQLAEISKLSVRTVQRVEQGGVSSTDTRRAIAVAFELEDIDALNKPHDIPTIEELMEEDEKFQRDYITLESRPLSTGKQLEQLIRSSNCDISAPAFEMGQEADQQFAAMIDFYREYRDCSEFYSEVERVEVYSILQEHIDRLKSLGVSLGCATRKLEITATANPGSTPMTCRVVYVVAFPAGKEPETFVTPRKVLGQFGP